MADVEPRQYWVRSENGKTWGPITSSTVDLFVANQVIQGRCQVSLDGQRFADPGRFPDVRDAFPQELWGSTEPLPGLEPVAPVLTPGAPPIATQGGRPVPSRPGGPPVMQRPPAVPGGPGAAPGSPPRVAPPGPPVMQRPAPAAGTPPTVAPAPPAVASPPPAVAPSAPKRPTTEPDLPAPAPVAAVKPTESAPTVGAASGRLGEESAFRVYYRLAAANASGLLTVTSPAGRFELFFKKGVPHQARSDQPADSVLQYMGEKGLLSSEAVGKAEAGAAQFGGDPVGAAFALGLVSNPGEFVAALTGHSVGLLKKLLRATEGSWSFDPAQAAPPTASPLGNKWALMIQAARELPGDEARKRLGDRLTAPVMKSGNLVTLEELGLNAQEARVAAAFEGVRSLAQLGEQLGDADQVARVGYVLGEVELAGFAVVRVAQKPTSQPAVEKPEPPAAPRPASSPGAPRPAAPAAGPGARPAAPAAAPAARPAAPAAGPGARPGPPVVNAAKPNAPAAPRPPSVAPAPPKAPAVASGVDILNPASLQAHLDKIAKQNHFEVLGVAENATGPAIKLAYLGLVKQFHPDTTPADAPPQVRPLREKIFTRINDANTVLSDDKARATYLDELQYGGDEKVDVEAIFKAEDLFTRASIMCKARKYGEALPMLDEAIQLNDKEAEFHAWRAWAQFMSATDKRNVVNLAMRGIDHALKMQPKCAQAAYFAGQMAKLLGDGAGATKWFKKTVELDANHLDAQRELRLVK